MSRKPGQSRFSLTLLFASVTFCILVVSIAVAGLLIFLFTRLNILPVQVESLPDILLSMLFVFAVCIIVGAALSMAAMMIPLKPINWFLTQMNRLASGDFKARLSFGKLMSGHPAFREVENSFNKLAVELESTEMLRSDFINNFSHEFKTPIVSIAGFAKLLQRGGLSAEQQKEYIDVIAEESMRLSSMATNVLNLTKVENQTILTDVSEFNAAEQIRSAVLLLESKWTRKHLELELELAELNITANEELLKEVWINLLDNAVKFSPDYGPLVISLTEIPEGILFRVTNSGHIPFPDLERIWNKFYQADTSHSAEGNGVGLAIVRRVVELHGGTVSVSSENGAVCFSVRLPRSAV